MVSDMTSKAIKKSVIFYVYECNGVVREHLPTRWSLFFFLQVQQRIHYIHTLNLQELWTREVQSLCQSIYSCVASRIIVGESVCEDVNMQNCIAWIVSLSIFQFDSHVEFVHVLSRQPTASRTKTHPHPVTHASHISHRVSFPYTLTHLNLVCERKKSKFTYSTYIQCTRCVSAYNFIVFLFSFCRIFFFFCSGTFLFGTASSKLLRRYVSVSVVFLSAHTTNADLRKHTEATV